MIEYPYYFNAKIISRKRADGGAGNAVAAAAYRAGQRLAEMPEEFSLTRDFNEDKADENGVVQPQVIAHDYRRRHGVMSSFIMTPKEVPEWAKDRGMLWNAVERSEKRKDSQLAREVVVSLPDIDIFDHLTSENKAKRVREFYEHILRGFVKEHFVAEGMIADVALHAPSDKNDDRHFHAHIMLTTRVITDEGFGQKERGWNDPKKLESWREGYAKAVNDALNAHKVKAFVDHRSYEERGLDYDATKPLGKYNFQQVRKGIVTIAGNDNQRVREENLIQHKYLEKVFEHSPVAPAHEILAAIERAGFEDSRCVMNDLVQEGKLKCLSSSETGYVTDMYNFTPMVKRLDRIKAKSENIYARKTFSLSQEIVDAAVMARGDKKIREALRYVAGREGFKVIETENTGHKTTFISSVTKMYKNSGYDVIAVTRNNQGKDSFECAGISKGVLTYRDFLRRFGDRYTGVRDTKPKVIIVDDASSLSPLQDQEIFNTTQKLNAKLIYIGDQKRKKKKLWQNLFLYYKRLTEFRRLREKFFKVSRETEAIRDAFVRARTLEALKLQRAKYLHIQSNAFEAKHMLLDNWFKKMKKRDDKRFILVSTDADAQVFNFEIQKHRLGKGHLTANTAKMFTVSYKSDQGNSFKRDMDVYWGDIIQFKKNYHDIGIDEGARARVLHHRHNHSLLEIDDGRLMKIDLVKHNGFDLGYAGRSVSQGGQLEQGYIYHAKANALDDAPLLYQMSQNPVRLYADKSTATDLTALAAQLLGRGHNLYEGYVVSDDKDILYEQDDNSHEGGGYGL